MLRLGTRGSRLALCQAGLAADALRDAGLGPVAIVPISTIGDRDRRRSFSELGGRGVFSSELEDALVADQIDVAVHSAKDLTTDDPAGLTLAAVLPRADPRDAWCGPQGSLAEVPAGARVGTASTRRTAQLGAIRPDIAIEGLRGNVDTRLRKRGERGLAAIVLAACGLDRLGLSGEIGFRVSPDVMLPEVGQGFIALQTRAADAAALAAVSDAEGLRILRTERAAAATFGGGCLAPVAAHAEPLAGRIRLRVWIGRPDGSEHAEASGEGDDPESLGRAVANEVLAAGGQLLLEDARA
ncbi:MAG: hydroxymethylbilane synthase [Gaiellales bacterium]